jgi:hypothetical protein
MEDGPDTGYVEQPDETPTHDMIVVRGSRGDIVAVAKYEADWQLDELAAAGFEYELTWLEDVGVIING